MTPGGRIGDYEILDVLGTGGMGKVYKVRNLHSDRIEAMKVLLPEPNTSGNLPDRFLREIKVQAALDHPHIARLNTAQMLGDQLIMFMEYVEGSSFETVLATRRLHLADTTEYSRQILDALSYAHTHDVVHRDIKPANVMLTPAGKVKLMDFGIARMKAGRRLTLPGLVIGSLPYMSPEQIRGGDPDARSDIYSFGIMLYEMTTGRRPFQGETEYSLMAAHLQQTPVPPVELSLGLPPKLNDIILYALAKEPDARFQTAEEFGAAISAVVIENIGCGNDQATISMATDSAPIVEAAADPPQAVPSTKVTAVASRRWLYAAAGSIVTIIALAGAIIEIPKGAQTEGASRATGMSVRSTQPAEFAGSRQPAEVAAKLRVGKPPTARRRYDADRNPVTVRAKAAAVDPPQVERRAQAPPLAAPKDLRDRLIDVEARADVCDALLQNLARQLSADGLGVNPALAAAQNEAKAKLEQAKQETAAGRYPDAKDSLDAADWALQVIERLYRQ